ncbi:MAG: glycosyltransferase family 4 protein [Sedimentisphaerales bacterium]|nr:glycosyltransferase family 4 protein [Sedimentisphaerales bacterium]
MTKKQKAIFPSKEAKKSIRPVFVVSQRTISEFALFLRYLLIGLADESIRSVLVCPPKLDIEPLVYSSTEVIRDTVFALPGLWRQNNRVLIDRLRKFGPTVLHCLCESRALFTRQLAGQLGLPYVLTVNSLQKKRSELPISLSRCAKITAPAKSIAENIEKLYPGFDRRIEQINIGTFARKSTDCFSNPSRLRGIVTAMPRSDRYGFENLLGAVKNLAISGYEFMLVVIADGIAEKQLRSSLVRLGLLQIVTVIPASEPWRSVLEAGDIFVHYRPRDTFDVLLLEAMAVGTAVAACKGGVDDLVVDDATAVVFDANNELSIRSSLQRLFDRTELAKRLANCAQDYARENHTVSGMISAFLRIYSDAQNGKNS